MNSWKFFFDDPVRWDRIGPSFLALMLHVVGCFVAAHIIIRRKDILT
jgi:hypothetical protein